MKIGVPENLIKLYGGFRGREFPQIVNKIVEQQISSETEPKVIFSENVLVPVENRHSVTG